MKDETLKIKAFSNPMDERINLYIRKRCYPDGELSHTEHPVVTWRKVKGLVHQDPTLVIDKDAAQELVNMLWDAGVRPAQSKGSSGQLEAVNKHLEDMRRLVFDGVKK